jgi:hypothetical protein
MVSIDDIPFAMWIHSAYGARGRAVTVREEGKGAGKTDEAVIRGRISCLGNSLL